MSLKERQKMRSLIPHNPLHTAANVDLLMLLKIKVVTRVLSGCSHKMHIHYTRHLLVAFIADLLLSVVQEFNCRLT